MPDTDSMGRYDVQLTGELLPGYDLDEAVEAIAALYRADHAHVAGLLAAAPCVCKSNVSRSRAERHVRALKQAGAVAVVAGRRGERSATDADTATASLPPTQTEPAPDALRSGSGDDAAAAELDPFAPMELDDAVVRDNSVPAAPGPALGPDADTEPSRGSRSAWRWVALGTVIGFVLGVGTAWLALPMLPPAGDDAGRAARPATAAPAEPEPAPAQVPPAGAVADAAVVSIDPPHSEPKAPTAHRVAAPAGKGPFGLEQGMALTDLDVADVAPEPGRRLLASVPEPMPLIERVLAILTPGTGLCGIEAKSRSIETAADGTALRAAFERMAAEVERRYGALERTDIRLSRAADAAGTSWMQRLRAGEQQLMSIWSATDASRLADGPARITLTATAPTDDRGLIRILYQFASYQDCMAELAAAADSD